MNGASADARLSRRKVIVGAAAQVLCLHIGARVARSADSAARHDVNFEERDAQAAVRDVLARAVRQPSAVLARLGAMDSAGLDVMHRSATLTIFAAHWAPQMSLPAHDHRMWALIGLYAGREDNIYWSRTAGGLRARSATITHSCTSPGAFTPMGVTSSLRRAANGIPRPLSRSLQTAQRSEQYSNEKTAAWLVNAVAKAWSQPDAPVAVP